jgi:threonylcarbamoyladenosine tRNA methylthiotransferase MtaB
MAEYRERLCPHLHLSMQSGNTLILKRMRRRATREILVERVAALREAIPGMVLSADVLVGFPTESDEHFADTLSAVETLKIAFPHVFTYSKRPGTPAARIPSQLPRAVKKERAEKVRALGKQVWKKQARSMLGRKLPVLVEKYGVGEDGCVAGRADNYFTVRLPAEAATEDWQEVEITGIEDSVLVAR